jgi:hypothetical protein
MRKINCKIGLLMGILYILCLTLSGQEAYKIKLSRDWKVGEEYTVKGSA